MPIDTKSQGGPEKDRLNVSNPIGRRFVILVVLLSSIITLALTAFQLYMDYRHDLSSIEARFMEVEQAHLPNISNALWIANDENIALQLRGIESLPDMQYLAVREGTRLVAAAGEASGRSLLEREYALTYDHRGEVRDIGTLTVIASLDGVYQRLLQRALTILASNALKTFVVATCMILLLRRLVTGRLEGFVSFLRLHGGEVSGAEYTPTKDLGVHDELAVAFEAFNELNRRLARSVDALRESEAKFRGIAENVEDLIWIGSSDWQTVHYVNPAYERKWGRRIEDLIENPMSWMDALDDDGRSATQETIERVQQEIDQHGPEAVTKIEFPAYKVTHPDGSVRTVLARAYPIESESGAFDRVVGIATDITELVRVQEDLRESDERLRKAQRLEAIGHLTGGVAHDFNNLLAVILGNLEHLRDAPDQAEKETLIDEAVEAVERGSDLTRNMLSFARRAALALEVLDLNRLVRSTGTWVKRTLPATVEMETSLLAGLWPIEVDKSSAQSSILNLVLNARDAMPEGGKLTIETSNVRIDDDYLAERGEDLVPGRYVMLAVTDTGNGIPPGDTEAIFEPFFTTKPVGSGSGLGLSMIMGFMKQSGGTIRVYSELGVGTTFKLYFKAASLDANAISERSVEISPDNGRGAKVLLVEDQPELLKLLVRTLERYGYAVTEANSGDEANQIFSENPDFDLLITDIVMPGVLQGTGLARELRAKRGDLPIIFMSGYAEEATVHGNGLRPEDIRLMKPVGRQALLKAVNSALNAKRSIR